MPDPAEVERMLRNGLIPPGPMAPQQTAIQVSAPMNNTHITALVAAGLYVEGMSGAFAVRIAIELIAETVTQLNAGELDRALAVAKERVGVAQ